MFVEVKQENFMLGARPNWFHSVPFHSGFYNYPRVTYCIQLCGCIRGTVPVSITKIL